MKHIQKISVTLILIFIISTQLFAQLNFSQSGSLGLHFTSKTFTAINPIDSVFNEIDSVYTLLDTTFSEVTDNSQYIGLTIGTKRKIGQLRPDIADIMISGRLTFGVNLDGFDKLFWQLPVTFDLDFESGFYAGVGFSFGAYDIKDGLRIRQIGPVANIGYNYNFNNHNITSRIYYLGNFAVGGNNVYGVELGYKTNLFRR